jgi:hypothetical protein
MSTILNPGDFRDLVANANASFNKRLGRGDTTFLVAMLVLLERKLKSDLDYKDIFEHAQLAYKQMLRRDKLQAVTTPATPSTPDTPDTPATPDMPPQEGEQEV